jgi:hypothetical protein
MNNYQKNIRMQEEESKEVFQEELWSQIIAIGLKIVIDSNGDKITKIQN